MGIDKVKSVYCRNLNDTDKVREMLIASANYSSDMGYCPVQEIVIQGVPKVSRKRRLDHLSAEEKIRRKKLKNREAAQTSRDRKKMYVTSLEDTVKLLQQENKLLAERVNLLEKENKKLRNCGGNESDVVPESIACGPAVSYDPLQQGAYLRKSLMTMTTRQCQANQKTRAMTLLILMSALTSWTGSQKILDSTKLTPATIWCKTSPKSLHLTSSLLPKIRKMMERRWWGPGGGKRAWKPPPVQLSL